MPGRSLLPRRRLFDTAFERLALLYVAQSKGSDPGGKVTDFLAAYVPPSQTDHPLSYKKCAKEAGITPEKARHVIDVLELLFYHDRIPHLLKAWQERALYRLHADPEPLSVPDYAFFLLADPKSVYRQLQAVHAVPHVHKFPLHTASEIYRLAEHHSMRALLAHPEEFGLKSNNVRIAHARRKEFRDRIMHELRVAHPRFNVSRPYPTRALVAWRNQ